MLSEFDKSLARLNANVDQMASEYAVEMRRLAAGGEIHNYRELLLTWSPERFAGAMSNLHVAALVRSAAAIGHARFINEEAALNDDQL